MAIHCSLYSVSVNLSCKYIGADTHLFQGTGRREPIKTCAPVTINISPGLTALLYKSNVVGLAEPCPKDHGQMLGLLPPVRIYPAKFYGPLNV